MNEILEHADLRKSVVVRPRIVKSFPLLTGFDVGGSFTINKVPIESFHYPVTEAPEDGKILRAVVTIDFVEDLPTDQEKKAIDDAIKAGLLPADTVIPNTPVEDRVRLDMALSEDQLKEATDKGLINP